MPTNETYPYYDFFNPDTKRMERVAPELWKWEAHYNDGTVLKQFDDETKKFHAFAEIEQSRLHVFKMVSDQDSRVYSIVFDPTSMHLMHYYRNTVLRYRKSDEKKIRTYCFGFKKIVESEDKERYPHGMVFKHVLMITGNEVVITDNPDRIYIE